MDGELFVWNGFCLYFPLCFTHCENVTPSTSCLNVNHKASVETQTRCRDQNKDVKSFPIQVTLHFVFTTIQNRE